jgi:hypothetical protein
VPRYHYRAARREVVEQEPLVLTLSGEAPDGSPLREFEEEFPREMPAAVQLIQLEAVLGDDDEEGAATDDEKAQMGYAVLKQVVGLKRIRKWMKAGYTMRHLFELLAVLLYYWNNGRFPNPPSAGNGASTGQTLNESRRVAEPSVSGVAS